jgi:hypothetical protein
MRSDASFYIYIQAEHTAVQALAGGVVALIWLPMHRLQDSAGVCVGGPTPRRPRVKQGAQRPLLVLGSSRGDVRHVNTVPFRPNKPTIFTRKASFVRWFNYRESLLTVGRLCHLWSLLENAYSTPASESRPELLVRLWGLWLGLTLSREYPLVRCHRMLR